MKIVGDQPVKQIDLSENGTANCYAVTEPGLYSFATRKVSGSEVEGIVRADWVWASRTAGEEGNRLLSEITYADGRISFTATGVKGNVLVAAYDASDRIVWSWHIWCTDDPFGGDLPYECGMTMMDRNLGATSYVPGEIGTQGLLYQWGRKEPFSGAHYDAEMGNGSTYWKGAEEITVMNDGYAWSRDYIPSDMEYAVTHPTEMIGNGQNGHWITPEDNTLWAAEKTDYDPCPPGYRVPEIGFGYEFTNGTWRVVDGVSEVYDQGDHYGIIYLRDGNRHFYPFDGQRFGDNTCGYYANFSSVGAYWTITFADNNCPYNFNIVDNGVIWFSGDKRWGACNANSVRCRKE